MMGSMPGIGEAEGAARLGKNPDRDGKLTNSPIVVPATAGTHFSASRNFQVMAMTYQPSSARAAEAWTPAFEAVIQSVLAPRQMHLLFGANGDDDPPGMTNNLLVFRDLFSADD